MPKKPTNLNPTVKDKKIDAINANVDSNPADAQDLIQIDNGIKEINTSLKDLDVRKLSTIVKLKKVLKNIWTQISINHDIPELTVRSRSKTNILEHENGYFTLGDKKNVKKSLKTKGGAKELLKIIKTIVYLLEQFKANRTSTIREFYYNTLNWIPDAQFETVNDSNHCLENLEVMLDLLREDLDIMAESDGTIIGPVLVQTKNRKGEKLLTHCQEGVNDSGFLLPRKFEDLKIINHNIKFALVIETGGFFSRLAEEGFDKQHNCLLIHTKGQPSRCLRRLLKYLNEELKIPIYGFSDCDVWGAIIINTIKRGAIKSSHLSDKLCTPNIKHIGLLPSHIERFKLPSDNITKPQRNMIELLLKDNRAPEELKKQLEIMLKTGKKAEQQSLSYWGLNYVSNVYLPTILKEFGAPINE